MARRTMLMGWMEAAVVARRRAWSRPAMASALSMSRATELRNRASEELIGFQIWACDSRSAETVVA
jgi:hypothetical protein